VRLCLIIVSAVEHCKEPRSVVQELEKREANVCKHSLLGSFWMFGTYSSEVFIIRRLVTLKKNTAMKYAHLGRLQLA
jgi:hypothetical protein